MANTIGRLCCVPRGQAVELSIVLLCNLVLIIFSILCYLEVTMVTFNYKRGKTPQIFFQFFIFVLIQQALHRLEMSKA